MSQPVGIQLIRVSRQDIRVRGSLRAILDRNVLASLATVSPSGGAYANTAYFAYGRDFSLYWYSYPGSQHSLNLLENPSMAAAVFDSHQVWGRADRGVQLFGTAAEQVGAASERAGRQYAKRYPGFRKWQARVERESGSFDLRAYRFVPRRVVVFDEPTLGGGKFWEVNLRGPRLNGRRA